MFFSVFAASLALSSAFSATHSRHVPLLQRGGRPLTPRDHFGAAERTRARYGFISDADLVLRDRQRRGTSQDISVTNEATDQYYYVEVKIGTPAQSFKVLLDTGSSDLWVGGTTCSSGCPTNVALYDSSKSSTAAQSSSQVTIAYGSGSVQGTLCQDTVLMGSYSVSKTGFLVGTTVTNNLITSPISGLIGLAFAGLSQTGTPFWQAIIGGNQASAPEMGFWLSRFRGTGNPTNEEPGGAFTFGGVNASLYTGDIEFLALTGTASAFWSLDLSAITVQGKTISFTSSTKLAAVDTGSTGISGPPADVQAIWAAVPGSSAITGQNGFYQFPCTTDVKLTVSFGGRAWPVSSVDLNLGPVTTGSSNCIGAIFGISTSTSSSSPGWVFGIAFLKNVYTVLRQTPAQVGFAELSSVAGGTGAPSSQSSGSTTLGGSSTTGPRGSTTVLGGSGPTSGSPQNSSVGAPGFKKKSNIGAIVGGVIGGLAIIFLIAAFTLYRWRRQNTTPASEPVNSGSARPPLSFVVEDPEKSTEPAGASGAAASPALQSLASMKREQAAAVYRYGDTHSAPDAVLQTKEGLHLSPGRASAGPASDVSSSSSALPAPVGIKREQAATMPYHDITADIWTPTNDGGQFAFAPGPGPSPGQRMASPPPPGARVPSPPAPTAPDPVLLELQSLREEVRRLAAAREVPEAPPSYHYGD